MIERAITIYIGKQLKALILVNEIDLGYLDRKIIFYVEPAYKPTVEHVIGFLGRGQVNIHELHEKLVYGFNKDLKSDVKVISTAFEVLSDNKNKTSRNKRMIEQEGLKNYVRVVRYVGIEKTKRVRK